MSASFAPFIDELRAEPCLGPEVADQMSAALHATEIESVTSKHARQFLRAVA